MTSVSVITPTGGRPEALALLGRMMERQTYGGSIQWVVVDDVDPASPVPVGVEVVRPEPRWQPGQNTQARNLLAGFEAAMGDYLLILEDDDWYAPTYIETMVGWLADASLVGEGHARYYHVGQRLFYQHDNTAHASLCQTALRRDRLELVLDVCRQGAAPLDIKLWQRGTGPIMRSEMVVGIKGLPGRLGIGGGHNPGMYGGSHDPELKILRAWIGDDTDWYAGFCEVVGA